MAGKFTLSKRADQQTKDIYKSTQAERGEHQADKYIGGLEHSLQLLADMPDMGRKCDHINKGYRRHEYGAHIIFYRKRKADIFIIQIMPDRMDVKNHLKTVDKP
ncbi:type II toxin-antitoxin system RelE/ParE family toxin [Porticoccus sp. GXU_MW_L64]